MAIGQWSIYTVLLNVLLVDFFSFCYSTVSNIIWIIILLNNIKNKMFLIGGWMIIRSLCPKNDLLLMKKNI